MNKRFRSCQNRSAGAPILPRDQDAGRVRGRRRAARLDQAQERDGQALFRAYKAVKGPDHPPVVELRKDAPAHTPSLKRLQGLADELRKREPDLSIAQAFTKVYTDPANRELAAQEKIERRAA